MANDERRANQRAAAKVAVRTTDGAAGITEDLSPTGAYMVIDRKFEPGAKISFTLHFDNPTPSGDVLELLCTARVVRVETRGDKFGIGAAVIEQRLSRVSRPAKPGLKGVRAKIPT